MISSKPIFFRTHYKLFSNLRKGNYSLLNTYFYVALGFIILYSLILCVITWSTYKSNVSNVTCQLQLESVHIERELNNIFDDATQIVKFLGSEVAKQNNPNNLKFISSVLEEGTLLKIHAIRFLTDVSNFDWVNTNGYQVINLKDGILHKPISMKHRAYVKQAKKEPWKLHLVAPTYGMPSQKWVIPAGLGVTNKKGQYLGLISLGFLVQEITKRLSAELKHLYTVFIIYDHEHNLIVSSNDTHLLDAKKSSELFKLDSPNSGIISDSSLERLKHDDIVYTTYKRSLNYPYTIIIGYNKSIVYNKFLPIVFSRMIESLGLSVFCFFLLFLFRNKVLLPIYELSKVADSISRGEINVTVPKQSGREMQGLAKGLLHIKRGFKRVEYVNKQLESNFHATRDSDNQKQEFLRKINQELKRPLNSIVWHSSFLRKLFDEKFSNSNMNEKILNSIDHIIESSLILKDLTTTILNFSPLNINDIIESSIGIEAKDAIFKNIKIITNLQTNLPTIYADELRIKQILVGLISICIDYSYNDSQINISSFIENKASTPSLKIVIQDEGLSFSKEDIIRLSENIQEKSVSLALSSNDIDLEIIEKLIKLHGGELEISPLVEKGKLIIITLPLNHHKTTQDLNLFRISQEKISKNAQVYNISNYRK